MAKFFTPSKLSDNIRKTPEGYLLCLNVPIARTGWQEYGEDETPLESESGKVWVFRDPKDVFRPQTIASFMGKSITIKHPEEFVEPENWKELTFGTVQNVRKASDKDEDGEEMLMADLLVTDEMAIGLINNGLREVSCGYDADYEQTGPGEGRQFNIIGNHVALVENGRAGPSYAIKDHKGEVSTMSVFKELKDTFAKLGKTLDAAEEAEKEKEKKAKKPPAKAAKVEDSDEENEEKEKPSYDELVSAVKDLTKQVAGMSKPADEEEMDEEEEDEEPAATMESRLKALEQCVAKLLKNSAGDDEEEEEESEDEESEMSGSEDEDMEDEEEEEKPKKTGDAARFEILTPGKKYEGKDARKKCLLAFSKTEEGKKILASVGMKKPVFDSKEKVNLAFLASAHLMKAKRGVGLDGAYKDRVYGDEVGDSKTEPMTPDQINELNAKHYGQAK